MHCINLTVSVPFCSFRKAYAREYLETERFPPPATVYGFLLSLIGEEDRHAYVGTHIALAVLNRPHPSVLLRTVWRVKTRKDQPGIGANRRPEYQEILSGLTLRVWVKDGPLAQRIKNSATYPELVDRFGGLSLGESRDLVNDINFFSSSNDRCLWLMPDELGTYTLPVWVDHVGSKFTRWVQFRYEEGFAYDPEPNGPLWIEISPSGVVDDDG